MSPLLYKNKNLIFVSYSHKDKKWLERLQIHLKPLEREGRISLWDDTLIATGSKWKQEIKKAIDKCKAAVLLISADFIASEFISKNDQVFLVLCGNYHEYNNRKGDTGEYFQVSKNKAGRDVIEILANYQGYPNGGDGWFRILVFNEKDNAIIVKTYSPFKKRFRKKHLNTPRASDFTISFDFKERLTF